MSPFIVIDWGRVPIALKIEQAKYHPILIYINFGLWESSPRPDTGRPTQLIAEEIRENRMKTKPGKERKSDEWNENEQPSEWKCVCGNDWSHAVHRACSADQWCKQINSLRQRINKLLLCHTLRHTHTHITRRTMASDNNTTTACQHDTWLTYIFWRYFSCFRCRCVRRLISTVYASAVCVYESGMPSAILVIIMTGHRNRNKIFVPFWKCLNS